MSIRIYVYKKKSKIFSHIEGGEPTSIIEYMSAEDDFTLTPPPDYNHVWRWIDSEWVADEPEAISIEDLQATMWSDIKDKRSTELSKGVLVESVNKTFQTDPNSIAEYNNVASMIALDNYDPIEWKTEDNTFILLTVDLFKELQKAISTNTQRIFKAAEDHKEAMLSLEDPLDYDYLTNW